MGPDAPPGHLLAQPDALAVPDVPVLLQVLRVRDAPAAPPRAGGGRADPRRRRAAQRQGAARAHRRGARPPSEACAAKLAELGHADFTAYVAWVCERALERGLLPHTNLGVLSREDLARLREVTASQGLMLESVNPDLVAHQGSPTKHPERRLETIRAAGELKIPFTSGILVGIGETEDERVAALEALAGRARAARPSAGGDPAELRPAPELLRAGAGGDRRGGVEGVLAHRPRRGPAARPPGVVDAGRHRGHEAPDRRGQAAAARRRRPGAAEPRRLVARARRRRRDRPRRPQRQRRPHLARAPVPVAAQGPQAARPGRRRADRAAVRLRRVHRPRVGRAGRARRHQDEVLELHPAPRLRPALGAEARAAPGDDRPRPRRRGADRARR